jgi:tRNA(fMet)-specific endonuclease VapC
LLDTHVVICSIKRRPIELMETFNQNAERMTMSVITLFELHCCAENSVFVTKKLAVAEVFASQMGVLPFAAKAAQHQGGIRRALEKAGQPIYTNDLHMQRTPAAKGLFCLSTTCTSSSACPVC